MWETGFLLGNQLALCGWALLVFVPRWRGIAQVAASLVIPALLSIAYSALIMGWWTRSDGGFGSLTAVGELFHRPELLLAGWLHYLAFDLLVGAWVARELRKAGVPHAVVVPVLLLTFLLGPVGYYASLVVRAAWRVGGVGHQPAVQRGRVRSSLMGLAHRQSHLAAGAFFCLAGAVPTALAAALDGRTFNGANVWFKPLKFELSVSLYLGTLAFFFPLASSTFRRSIAARMVVWGSISIGILEIAYIAWRASRGEASHFNTATPVAAALYGLMGVGAVLLAAASPVLACGIARNDVRSASSVYRLAVILGLVLSFVLGTFGGAVMSAGTGHNVGSADGFGAALPFIGWSRTVGDLRVPHFIGMHALQVIPLAGACAARWLGRWGYTAIIAVAALYAVVTMTLFVQAVAGRPLLPV